MTTETTTLSQRLAALRREGRKALVPFFTAGYPDDETFLRMVAVADELGCPVIEIGLPFSDPVADGEAIQASSAAVLAGGMTLNRTLELVARARKTCRADLVLMGYLNPILKPGLETFAKRAADAGITGVIVPDLPMEESTAARGVFSSAGLVLIDLIAPTTGPERAGMIIGQAAGFVYLVSLTGVTGAAVDPGQDLPEFASRVRAKTELPLYVGFGVDSPARAAGVCRHADGAIIGSALVRIIQSASGPDDAVTDVATFLEACRTALDEFKGAPK